MNVLIVEDEKKTAELLKKLIEERSDYLVVHTCPGIESTVRYLKKHQNKLDLIFMDFQLKMAKVLRFLRKQRFLSR